MELTAPCGMSIRPRETRHLLPLVRCQSWLVLSLLTLVVSITSVAVIVSVSVSSAADGDGGGGGGGGGGEEASPQELGHGAARRRLAAGTFESLWTGRAWHTAGSVASTAVGFFLAFWMGAVIIFLCVQRRRAARGNKAAAGMLILPVFLWVFYITLLSDLIVVVITMAIPFHLHFATPLSAICWGAAWGLQRPANEGVTLFLLHRGAGARATRNAIIGGVLIGILTGTWFAVAFWVPNIAASLTLEFLWEVAFLVFYGILAIVPDRCFFRRPALRGYSWYWFILRTVLLTSNILRSYAIDAGYGLYFVGIVLIYAPFKPLVMYWTLHKDTKYWIGGYADATQGSMPEDRITAPFDGWGTLSNTTATDLARRMDQLVAGGVQYLHFGYLHLDQSKILGVGAVARVYRGRYKDDVVALKLVYCIDLTKQEVESFTREAALLCFLEHPNVVHTYGVCILPPSMCIVMELCERGSLYDVLHNAETRREVVPAVEQGAATLRQLELCLGAARGVAFLHSKGVLHRDLKSHNFLVTAEWVVKVADLGTTVRAQAMGLALARGLVGENSTRALRGDSLAGSSNTILALGDSTAPSEQSLAGALSGHSRIGKGLASKSATPKSNSKSSSKRKAKARRLSEPQTGTLEWIAPEVMRGAAFTQASDVYSLALVMWEVLTGKVPYSTDNPELMQHGQPGFARAVCGSSAKGKQPVRPAIPKHASPALAQLLEAAWQDQPHMRPPAEGLIASLEAMIHRQAGARAGGGGGGAAGAGAGAGSRGVSTGGAASAPSQRGKRKSGRDVELVSRINPLQQV